MKYLLLSVLFLQTLNLSGQEKNIQFNFYTGNKLLADDTLSIVKIAFAGTEKNPYYVDSLHYFDNIDSVKSFIKRKNLTGPFEGSLDSYEHALILAAYSGVDCHSKFEINIYDNTETKEYIFSVKVIYGGCRAGGKYFLTWFQIPRLPEDYKLKYHWFYVDP